MSVPLTRFAWLCVAAALVTIALKAAAWWLTGSVGLLSDALESLVNLAGALMALAMLALAAQPPDDDHAYGHDKAEYFSSGFEGLLIIAAAIGIGWAAIDRLMSPRALLAIDLGVAVSVAAALINGLTARVLFGAARRHESVALAGSAHHLMTDVWTSVGVIIGVVVVGVSGIGWLDPVLALAVAANIVRTGWHLVRGAFDGLMDAALPAEQRRTIEATLARFETHGVRFHALRTRKAGANAFVSLHVLVPDEWTVRVGHEWVERIEEAIREAVPRSRVFTHLEPRDDPAAYSDQGLDR